MKKTAKKLALLKTPRKNSSNTNIHYDFLDTKHLPKLNHGYLVQVDCREVFSLEKENSVLVLYIYRISIEKFKFIVRDVWKTNA